MPEQRITVINNNTMRGIIAPSEIISKELLTDLIDFIELSSKQSAKETEMILMDKDNDSKWNSLDDLRKQLKKE